MNNTQIENIYGLLIGMEWTYRRVDNGPDESICPGFCVCRWYHGNKPELKHDDNCEFKYILETLERAVKGQMSKITPYIRLVRVDFDNMENRDAKSEIQVGIFVDGEKVTAHGAVANYFVTQQPVQVYLGWDGNVYPQFRLEHGVLK